MSTQLAVPTKKDWETPTGKSGLERLANFVAPQLARGLPKMFNGHADRLLRAMITETSNSPKLLDCTPLSLFGGVMQAGQLGLMIGGPLGEAYLIPFKSKAVLVIGYKGFVALAHRSQLVSRITPRVVRQGDGFDVRLGTEQSIIHTPQRGSYRPATDYYCVMQLVNGGVDFELFSHDDAIEFRDRYSMARTYKSGPWYEMMPGGGFEQMALKTMIRRIAKRMPLSADMSSAVVLDESADRETPQNLDLMIDMGHAEPETPDQTRSEQLREKLDAAKAQAKIIDPPSTQSSQPAGDSPEADAAYAVLERYGKLSRHGMPRVMSEIKANCKIESSYWTDFTADEISRAVAYARESIREMEKKL